MQKFSRLQAIAYSFFSKELYRDVAHRWEGIGFIYFLLMFVIAFSPLIFHLNRMIDERMEYVDSLVVQFPDVTIEPSGEITSFPPGKTIVIDPATNEPVIVFDTSKLFGSETTTTALVTVSKNGLIINQKGKPVLYPIKPKTTTTLSQPEYLHYTKYFQWSVIAILIAELLAYFLVLYAVVLLFAFAAWIYTRFTAAELSYAACLRLGLVALTPTLVLEMVKCAALGAQVLQNFYFFSWEVLLFVPYYFFAIYVNHSPLHIDKAT